MPMPTVVSPGEVSVVDGKLIDGDVPGSERAQDELAVEGRVPRRSL